MFTTIIVRPIFNLLVLIYGILPGHDVGLSIIIFTVVIRLILWPLVKKQLTQAKAMKELQPEIKRIKQATKGNRQEESRMLMELYKEREVSPFSSIGPLIIQFIVLIGLYIGLERVAKNPHLIVSYAYPGLRGLPWIHHLASGHIHDFHNTFLGIVNLNRSALSHGAIYFPALVLVFGSAITQYFQSKQLMPSDANARGLKDILRDSKTGKQADQSEMSAAVGRGTRYFLPAIVFIFTISYPATLGLYWFVGGLVAYIQQAIVLREDTDKLEAAAVPADARKNPATIKEAEVVASPTAKSKTAPQKHKKPSGKKKQSRKKRSKK
ncbi:MAG: YidC/Oxa1 family membrane protein insertase [Candidatus Saccharimonadales bacterium]